MDRYHRQSLLPQIGPAGQQRLAAARVVLVGCGALGTVIADQLVRAGVGTLRICDRDIVETTNLQRQVLFDERDAANALPKATAAAERLLQINSSVTIDPRNTDVHPGNIEQLLRFDTRHATFDTPHLLLDGTDNVEIRYLLNDVAIKHNIPWVYGACVGTEGRMMAIRPGVTSCLRCLFPEPPGAGELPTCDTAGVLAPAASIVASLQVVAAIKILIGAPVDQQMTVLDAWTGRFRQIDTTGARREDCPTCGRRDFQFLDRPTSNTTSLCGRDAVQVRPSASVSIDTEALNRRLGSAGAVQRTPHFLRCRLDSGETMTVFPDGRAIINGTSDVQRARSLYARYVGA